MLRDLRTAASLSQRECAQAIGVTRGLYSQIECGARPLHHLTPKQVDMLRRVFDLDDGDGRLYESAMRGFAKTHGAWSEEMCRQVLGDDSPDAGPDLLNMREVAEILDGMIGVAASVELVEAGDPNNRFAPSAVDYVTLRSGGNEVIISDEGEWWHQSPSGACDNGEAVDATAGPNPETAVARLAVDILRDGPAKALGAK